MLNYPIIFKTMTEDITIGKRLKAAYPEAVIDGKTFRGELTINIKKAFIQRAAEFLHNDNESAFDYLSDLCGVDLSRLDGSNNFEVVYHLYSIKLNHRLRLKVKIPASNPRIDTVTNVWKTADWHERETYDMFGIIFKGHPNLERILTPEGFEGYPLRKDYPLKGRQPKSLKSVYREGR
ncbi:NADH-quinone oxidoreductase subunit C [Candidatus Scalindua japonica]|uniref:NADH-quinone oxidoreductase subunit C n=1 Tax=Candidatus Scalindua japonica TaxID=1284222 RepID=UPI002714FB71|nr:NADH-quinone oxidoreductase subunit C [Candidatus Scalindua japonica]